jgi:hypothetical protein
MVLPPESVPMLLARHLQRALTGAESGALEVSTRRERHRLYVRAGYVVHVELSGGQEPLGLVLAEAGLLSLGELRTSLRRRSGELYGLSLIQGNVLTAESVSRGLRLQMARRAARLYGLDEARFSFAPGPLPSHALAAPGTRLHPLELLCLAARHPGNAQRSLAHVLARLKLQRLQLAVSLADLQRMPALRDALSDAEWNALEFLADGCRLSDLLAEGLLPAAATSALVEALFVCGSLSVDGAEEAGARSARSPTSAEEPLVEIRREVRRGGEPHRLLGVVPGTSRTGLRAAYRRRALLLHPDRWTTGAPRDLPELFAAVAQAYRTLSAQCGDEPKEETRHRAVNG